jgi:hypothetical protein
MIEADEWYTEPIEWYEYLPITILIITGFEISKEYCDIAEGRIKNYLQQKKLFEVI